MLRLEFWLLLPCLGLAFWLISGLTLEYSLNRDRHAVESFNITPDRPQTAERLSITVTIDSDRGTSMVEIKQAMQSYRKQEFALTTTKLPEIEREIAQKLALPIEKVRRKLRYQIKNSQITPP